MRNKKTLRILSLLGISSILAVSASSCLGVKQIIKSKSNESNKPVDNSDNKTDINKDKTNTSTTEDLNNKNNDSKNDSGESNIHNNGEENFSSEGDEGSAEVNNIEDVMSARSALNALIVTKSSELSKYELYGKIKTTLESSFNTASMVKENSQATLSELNEAKTALQTAIDTAASSKTTFDNQHNDLIMAFNSLDQLLKNTNINTIETDTKYSFIKTELTPKFTAARNTISQGYQKDGLSKDEIERNKTEIQNSVHMFESTYKSNADELDNGKLFEIKDENFKGTFTNNNNNYNDNSKVMNIFSANADLNFKYASRQVFLPSAQSGSNGTWSNLEKQNWIWKLNGTDAKYEFSFMNYASNSLKLIFPYKIYSNTNRIVGNSNQNVQLSIKLNEQDVQASFTDARSDSISLAQIQLSNVRFGENKLTFSVPNNKVNPVIGNMYILSNNNNLNTVVNNLNSQVNENGLIKIHLVSAIGGSTSFKTYFHRISTSTTQTHDVLMRIGKYQNNNDKPKYTLPVWIPQGQEGNYNFGFTYNTTESNASAKIKHNNNEITISSITATEANEVKTIDPSTNSTMKLNLSAGWNNITLFNDGGKFPNLEYLLLKRAQ
ncbi:hypothetical protein [Mycoplasma bradburyae]|uniref:hypothetical protein n=1 Tax=Mycoplasma bradburyae TaxID=2963128 RepID=UPI002340303D|nr:hypothetical protein [Mycoplasma bradburyae]MDC4182608.1 hypothetical protein [Mycoplasma bradburyae]